MTTEVVPRAPAMALGTLSDPKELGTVLAASGYFQDARDAAQAVVKVLAGAELGFGPIASMTGVYIVKGRVTLSANLMAAAIRRHPKYDYRIKEHTDARAEVVYLDTTKKCATCKGTGRLGEKRCDDCVGSGLDQLGSSEFTMDHARRANLAGGENWKKYPGNMLLWRAMSNGAKFFTPDAFSGSPVYMPDELGADFDGETGEIIDASPAVALPTSLAPTAAPEPEHVTDRTASGPASTTAAAGKVEMPAAPVVPEPTPEPEPAPEPEPEADPNRQVTEDEVGRLRELLDSLGAPEQFWKMALMGYGAADFKALSVGQAHAIMEKANRRFGDAKVAT